MVFTLVVANFHTCSRFLHLGSQTRAGPTEMQMTKLNSNRAATYYLYVVCIKLGGKCTDAPSSAVQGPQ